jgi:hypothetical protein
MAYVFLLAHLAAASVGVLLRRATVWSGLGLFALAFFPAGLEATAQLRNAAYLRNQAPYDRFRDYLASPVPASVSNLRFVPLEEQIRPDLMLRFDIAPEHLDSIIASLRLRRVTPDELLNPKDFFRLPYYLPIDGEYHLFQGEDEYGSVLTVKANVAHSHTVFRKESASTYRDRRWETAPPIQIKMDEEALARLKQKHGAGK